jgi:F-type H+-transporting ATPase subunit b
MEQFMLTLPEPMRINSTFLFVLVVFIVLVVLLKRFYVDSYAGVMEKRQDIIEGAERKLKDVEALYVEKLAFFEAELKNARMNANALRERLVGEARKERESIVTRARSRVQERKARMEKETMEVIEKEKAAAGLLVNSLAEQIAESLVGRKIL